jgi:hypothetical protein
VKYPGGPPIPTPRLGGGGVGFQVPNPPHPAPTVTLLSTNEGQSEGIILATAILCLIGLTPEPLGKTTLYPSVVIPPPHAYQISPPEARGESLMSNRRAERA